ncbi:hypothetical protein FY034_01230 [Trichlorobacter lovleyi]|nr:hypothetical protein FY034_01230 [Trichlorobacter lovleyi]
MFCPCRHQKPPGAAFCAHRGAACHYHCRPSPGLTALRLRHRTARDFFWGIGPW